MVYGYAGEFHQHVLSSLWDPDDDEDTCAARNNAGSGRTKSCRVYDQKNIKTTNSMARDNVGLCRSCRARLCFVHGQKDINTTVTMDRRFMFKVHRAVVKAGKGSTQNGEECNKVSAGETKCTNGSNADMENGEECKKVGANETKRTNGSNADMVGELGQRE